MKNYKVLVYVLIFSYVLIQTHSNPNDSKNRQLRDVDAVPLTIFGPPSFPHVRPSNNMLIVSFTGEDGSQTQIPSSSPTTSMQPTYYVTPFKPPDMGNGDDDGDNIVVKPPSIHELPNNELVQGIYLNEIWALGYMCDIIPRSNMNVEADTRLDLFAIDVPLHYADSSKKAEIELYIRYGTHQQYERRPNAWTFVYSAQFMTSSSNAVIEIVELTGFDPLPFINEDNQIVEEAAIYIHCSKNCYIQTSAFGETGEIFAEDENLMLLVGTVKSGGGIFQNSIPDHVLGNGGIIKYMTTTSDFYQIDSSPSNSPGAISSTAKPTILRSTAPSEGITVPILVDESPLRSLQSGTYSGSKSSPGVMFIVESSSNVSHYITGLDIHTDATTDINLLIYYKDGSYDKYHRRPKAWTLIFDGNTKGMGKGKATTVPLFDLHILLETGNAVSFYATLETNSDYSILSSDVTLDGNMVTSDTFINIFVGVGKGGSKLFSNTFPDFGFEGVIHYNEMQHNTAANVASSAISFLTHSSIMLIISTIIIHTAWFI